MTKKLEMNELLDADYDNVVLRVFKGKAIEECPTHGSQDRVLCINNGTAGKGEFVCFDCFMDLIKNSCMVFNKRKSV